MPLDQYMDQATLHEYFYIPNNFYIFKYFFVSCKKKGKKLNYFHQISKNYFNELFKKYHF